MGTIQIKNLPDEVVRTLKVRAASKGQSLQQYMVAHLTEETEKPTLEELFARIEREDKDVSRFSAEDSLEIIQEQRAAREKHLAELTTPKTKPRSGR